MARPAPDATQTTPQAQVTPQAPATPQAAAKPKRGRKAQPKVMAEQLIGRPYLALLQGHLERMRGLYPHGNRVLFYDDVVVAYVVAFFNPCVRSLRDIEDASQLPGINRFLDVEAICRSTLSAANELFDPAHLQGLIGDLKAKLPNLPREDSQLASLLDKMMLVDGSFFRLAADVEWAVRRHNQHTKATKKPACGYVRLNMQFSNKTGCPDAISINGHDGVGEGAASAKLVTPETGMIYVMDSGVVSFAYLKAILGAESHFLCALAQGVKFAADEQRPLTPADSLVGVVGDSVGHLSGSDTRTAPEACLREILVNVIGRDGKPRTLRLLTDLLDLPAHVIAELYRQRWQVELFFRWFKVSANFKHLTSHSRNGIALSFHIAVIACLLMCLRTQKPLSSYAYNLLALVGMGMGEVEDIIPLLENRERERQRDRARQAKKRAQKKIA